MKKTHPLLCLILSTTLLSSFLFPSFRPSTVNSVAKYDSAPLLTFRVQPVADSLHSPTAVAFPGNGDVWVTEQTGQIRLIRNGKLQEMPILDLKNKMIHVNKGYEERGLLGITLHPHFKSNRKFYVFYSAPSDQPSDHKDVIAEYVLAHSGSIDPNSGRIVLAMEKPQGNHDGGCIQFGPDGYLYLSFGDGGGQGDKHGDIGNGQNRNTLLGKILRIDVSAPSGYKIPKTNPFFETTDVRPEIWAYGFRNPYRFSFDRATGLLFAGDVGQDLWEEVDIVKRGANYGWRLTEGTHCYNPATGCDMQGITLPIAEYSHKEGISVIGGYVYNGSAIVSLKRKYLFADWTGKIYYLRKASASWQMGNVVLQNLPPYTKILGFGEDPAGEIYLLTNRDTGPENKNGNFYKIVRNP